MLNRVATTLFRLYVSVARPNAACDKPENLARFVKKVIRECVRTRFADNADSKGFVVMF